LPSPSPFGPRVGGRSQLPDGNFQQCLAGKQRAFPSFFSLFFSHVSTSGSEMSKTRERGCGSLIPPPVLPILWKTTWLDDGEGVVHLLALCLFFLSNGLLSRSQRQGGQGDKTQPAVEAGSHRSCLPPSFSPLFFFLLCVRLYRSRLRGQDGCLWGWTPRAGWEHVEAGR